MTICQKDRPLRICHIEIRNFRGIRTLSWHVKGDFNCIIGAGDTCKTTILTALDYALSPRTGLSFVFVRSRRDEGPQGLTEDHDLTG